MSLWRWIVKQFDKIATSPGLIWSGQWRVHYTEVDRWSIRMTYDAAKSYAEIFNGTVHHVRYNDPKRTP